MQQNNTTLRLIYPQWQGADIADWFPDLAHEDASKGYYLGSQLLNFLASNNNHDTAEIPISLDMDDLKLENGITARGVILKQTKSALEVLNEKNPERIITLGGECSVSVVPFTYLASKYPDDVAVVWIDAHPDISLPGDKYTGYHAMALTASLGIGDNEIMGLLPAKFDVSKALIVGLRSWDTEAKARQQELGLKGLSPLEVKGNSDQVLNWLKSTGVSKVVIHFDLDVLDPEEIYVAVGREPNGMKIQEVLRVINDISEHYDVVGLTVAEYFPKEAIKLRNILCSLPLLN